MLENGYIKLHRSMSSWRWYKEPKTVLLWVHLLLNANYEPRAMADRTIERGQIATSLSSLSEQTGLTIKEVRTSLDRLKKTGEISVYSNRHMTVITIAEYDRYQSDEGKPRANQGQTDSKPTADQGQTEGKQRATMKEREESKKAKKGWSVPLPPDAETMFSENLLSAVSDWLTYKHERGEDYKPTGLQSLLTQIRNKAGENGDAAVCDVIRLSMSNNWRGIIWDRIGKPTPGTPQNQPAPMSDWEREQIEQVRKRRLAAQAAGEYAPPGGGADG